MKIQVGALFVSVLLAFGLGDITEPVEDIVDSVEDTVEIVEPVEVNTSTIEETTEPLKSEVDEVITIPDEVVTGSGGVVEPQSQPEPEPRPTRTLTGVDRVVEETTVRQTTSPDTEVTTESTVDDEGNTETVIERTETETRFVDTIPYWIWIIIGAVVGVALSALYFMVKYRRKFDKLKQDIMDEFNIQDLTKP